MPAERLTLDIVIEIYLHQAKAGDFIFCVFLYMEHFEIPYFKLLSLPLASFVELQ